MFEEDIHIGMWVFGGVSKSIRKFDCIGRIMVLQVHKDKKVIGRIWKLNIFEETRHVGMWVFRGVSKWIEKFNYTRRIICLQVYKD